MKIKLYLDEDVDTKLAPVLRQLGWDTITVADVNRRGLDDEDQLLYATENERTILTHNTSDYTKLNKLFWNKSLTHHGIIVAPQRDLKFLLKCLRNLLNELDSEDMIDHVEYLTKWY